MAACVMSVYLIASSLVTTLLIPADAFEEGGSANGRALAYLAHRYLGDGFGTVYDVSTILILWFAGASAMAGMLNLIPRYLPALRHVAGVGRRRASARAGPHRRGLPHHLDLRRRRRRPGRRLRHRRAGADDLGRGRGHPGSPQGRAAPAHRGVLPDRPGPHLHHAGQRPRAPRRRQDRRLLHRRHRGWSRCCPGWRVPSSSAPPRSSTTRAPRPSCATARAAPSGSSPTSPDARDVEEYRDKIRQIVDDHDLPDSGDIVFVEVTVGDYSDFESRIEVHGEVMHDHYRVLTVTGASVPNTLASLLLDIRDRTGVRPHIYFEWTEGNPVAEPAPLPAVRRRRGRPRHPRGAATRRARARATSPRPRRVT